MNGEQRILIPKDSRLKRWVVRLWQWILQHTWFTHQPVILFINTTSETCIKTLETAARPSSNRLHHRNLFRKGRRYHFQGRRDGFRLTTTASKRWRYPKRTSSSIVMWGTCIDLDDHLTQLTLYSRVDVGFLLNAILIPTGMMLLMISAPWPPLIITALTAILYGLSWGAHRSQMVLEASEMIWFIQRVLDDISPPKMPLLKPGKHQDVIDPQPDFDIAWDRFYHDQTSKQVNSDSDPNEG